MLITKKITKKSSYFWKLENRHLNDSQAKKELITKIRKYLVLTNNKNICIKTCEMPPKQYLQKSL